LTHSLLRFSEAVSLALHTIIYLSSRKERMVSTKEVAAAFQASEAHLAKVMQRLVRVGLVKSLRGPKGGFALNRPAEEISLLEVYQEIEGPLGNGGCLLSEKVCDGKRCVLGGLLAGINHQIMDYLRQTKIVELAGAFGGERHEN
jgi:Rrf2 family protein